MNMVEVLKADMNGTIHIWGEIYCVDRKLSDELHKYIAAAPLVIEVDTDVDEGDSTIRFSACGGREFLCLEHGKATVAGAETQDRGDVYQALKDWSKYLEEDPRG